MRTSLSPYNLRSLSSSCKVIDIVKKIYQWSAWKANTCQVCGLIHALCSIQYYLEWFCGGNLDQGPMAGRKCVTAHTLYL